MNDYSDLVKRLRRDGIAARDTLKCAELAPTVDPEDALDAVAAIEALVGEMSASRVQQKLIEQHNRIIELEAALQPFAYYAEQIPDDVSDTASASGTVGDLRQARKVLGEKE